MTHGSNAPRVIGVEGLSRVEGEGSLRVEVLDGTVTDVALEIFEPPRYFEALLVGRHFTEAPDITARICGICPVAYQMSACAAMEDACGVTVDEEIGRLRRLLYCGEWIQSHALHIYLLHAPDFLGCADAVELAEHRPGGGGTGPADQADREPGHGDRGRPGRAPRQRPGGRLLPGARSGGDGGPRRAPAPCPGRRAGHGGVGGGVRLPRRVGRLPLRGVARRRPLRHRARPPGVLRGPGREPRRARRPRRRGARGPVHRPPRPARRARPATSPGPWHATRSMRDRSPPAGRRGGRAAPGWARSSPTRSAASWCAPSSWCSPARRRCRLVESYDAARAPGRRRRATTPASGTGATEAPRGLLFHQYEIDGEGTIRSARIVPPTSQNQLDHRGGPAPRGRGRPRARATTTCSGAASSRSATTIPASRAPPTSSTSRWWRREPGRTGPGPGRTGPRRHGRGGRHGERVPARRRRRPGGGGAQRRASPGDGRRRPRGRPPRPAGSMGRGRPGHRGRRRALRGDTGHGPGARR